MINSEKRKVIAETISALRKKGLLKEDIDAHIEDKTTYPIQLNSGTDIKFGPGIKGRGGKGKSGVAKILGEIKFLRIEGEYQAFWVNINGYLDIMYVTWNDGEYEGAGVNSDVGMDEITGYPEQKLKMIAKKFGVKYKPSMYYEDDLEESKKIVESTISLLRKKNLLKEQKMELPKKGTPEWHKLELAKKILKTYDTGTV